MKQTLYTNCKGKITNNGTCDTCGQKASSSNSNCWKMIPIDNLSNSASNELASYKAELREKIDKILESDKQGMVDFKHNFSTYRYYEGRVCRLEDIKKSLLEDNPT